VSWRNVALALGAVCLFQTWRACHTPEARVEVRTTECEETPRIAHSSSSTSWDDDHDTTAAAKRHADSESMPDGPRLGAIKLPAWSLWLMPHPGESMLDYRDRMVPLAQTVLAPHRARVARSRDDFAKSVGLDAQQRAQLDGAVADAAGQIEDKMMNAFMSGDLSPSTFKPMTGVSLARDVLDIVDRANGRFVSSLREDQKTKMAQHPFDFADYLMFSARWEEALGVTN
jgi:hypothetical protein